MRSLPICAIIAVCAANTAMAQVPVVVTQWNFNSVPPDTSNSTGSFTPNIGLGTCATFGGLGQVPFDSAGTNSTDPATTDNTSWRVGTGAGATRNAPQGQESGGRGVQFNASTANYNSIKIKWDQRFSSTSSRYMQVFYSLDGTNFVAFPQYFSPPSVQPAGTDTWINQIEADLSAVPGVANNPNFKFRIAGVFAPSASLYEAPDGTTTSYDSGGNTQRYDMVTISGVPINQTNPSGSGVALPQAVCPSGGTITLKVTVIGGLLPDSTGLQVKGNLTTIGGSANQAFADDGQNGDELAGDGTYTYVATVPAGVSVGAKSLPITITDAELRTGTTNIAFSVADCATNSASRVVISQVFGGGGNLGPPAGAYNADFVELYNRSGTSVDLSGWSVQYASPAAAGGFDNAGDRVLLSGSIKPGQYLLVRMSDPEITGSALPTPDFINQPGLGGMGSNAGRVALVRTTALIGANCSSTDVEDFVGYGSAAACFEGGAPTATTANDTAALRNGNGAQDFNQNFNDFTVGAPTPRNRASDGFLVGQPAASVTNVCAGDSVTFTVAVTPGQAPASSGVGVTANLTTVGGAANAALLDNGLNGDQSAGDGVYTLVYAVPGAVTQGVKTITFTTTDAQTRSDSALIALGVGNCTNSSAQVVISQVFGGGGNSGAIFNADYVEIFNRSQSTVNLSGWSIQYADAAPATFLANRSVALSGSIGPGQYRLIVTTVPSGSNGVPVPTADFAPAAPFGMDSANGRIALVNSTVSLGANCSSTSIVDFVGYGTSSGCFEGVAPTVNLSNQTAATRKDGGCRDTNQTALDFDVSTPFDIPKNSASPANPCPVTNVNCCRGTTCNSVASGACTGQVAGSASLVVGSCGAGNALATCCFADFNHDGIQSIDDLFLYFNAYFTGSPWANMGGDGVDSPTIDDLFLYINAYFGTCI